MKMLGMLLLTSTLSFAPATVQTLATAPAVECEEECALACPLPCPTPCEEECSLEAATACSVAGASQSRRTAGAK